MDQIAGIGGSNIPPVQDLDQDQKQSQLPLQGQVVLVFGGHGVAHVQQLLQHLLCDPKDRFVCLHRASLHSYNCTSNAMTSSNPQGAHGMACVSLYVAQ